MATPPGELPPVELRLAYAEVRPAPEAVAQAVGYPEGEVPEVLGEAIAAVEAHGEALWEIRGGCFLHAPAVVDGARQGLEVAGQRFEVGKVVAGQLLRARAAAAFLCTAGDGIGALSRRILADGDPFTGVVADAMGSLAVEAAMDRLQDALAAALAPRGLAITNRYSPGYCGWHVSEQQRLFRLLPEGYAGVRLTDSSLMRPIKTVSGLIGVGPDVRRLPYTCTMCERQDCLHGRAARRAEQARTQA